MIEQHYGRLHETEASARLWQPDAFGRATTSIFDPRSTVDARKYAPPRNVPNDAELEPTPRVAAGDGLAPTGRGRMIDGFRCNAASAQSIARFLYYPSGFEPVAGVAGAIV
jgi:hypothetical protein